MSAWTPAATNPPTGLFMVATPDPEYPVWLGYFEDGAWFSPDAEQIEVTHWMSLPKGPK